MGETPAAKILMVITDLRVGGVPLHLFRLANALQSDEFDIHVACLASTGPVGERFERETTIPVHYCHAKRKRNVLAFWRLRRIIRRVKPDLIHAMLFHANVSARLVGPTAGVPASRIITEIQTIETDQKWHLTLDRLTIKRTAVEIGNARAVVKHLHEAAGIPISKLLLISGGVDVEAIANAVPLDRAEAGVPPNEPIVIWVGRLDPVKGFEEMIDAFARVAAKRPCRFWLIGEGPYHAAVEALIRKFKLSNRVQLLGNRDDVPRLLKAADVFLLGSRTEGMPNALLEAMAAGLPCVATDIPACREIILHQSNGLLARHGDPQAMSKQVLRYMNDPEWARRLGRAAADFVAEHHAQNQQFDRYRDLYRRVLIGRPLAPI